MESTRSGMGFSRQAATCLLMASIGICGSASRVQAQAIPLPGQFEVENFDAGGEGVAYHDVEAANLGGQYRPTDGVDIQVTSDTGGGYNVGWTKAGEWLRYTVNTTMSGTYTIGARVASNGSGGTFHVEVDGVNVTGSLTIADTGGWQTWRTMASAPFTLTAGAHAVRLVMDAVGSTTSVGNFNWLSFARIDSQSTGDWTLAWSDEFTGTANTGADTTNWTYETDNAGASNGELELYTSSLDNVAKDGNGHLIITARQTGDGSYTSGRINTLGKQRFQYGKIETRVKVPSTQGSWPAFWMLGTDLDTTGPWPSCGEIDILENIGREPAINHGSLHGPGYSGASPLTATYTLPGGTQFNWGYHTFAVQWQPGQLMFFVDDRWYETRTPASMPAGGTWVYEHPFFLILNLAVGGGFPGNPDATSVFPISMSVDYVRVWSLPEGQGCFNDLCPNLPGLVQAENYDTGGEGVAYHDLEAVNQGGDYRPVEAVDVATTSDGSNLFVGWLKAGEWLNYTVTATASQPYTFSAQVASAVGGGQFHVEVDGVNVTGTLIIPNTTGWQTWNMITSAPFNMTAGRHVVTLVMDANGSTGSVGNINWFALN